MTYRKLAGKYFSLFKGTERNNYSIEEQLNSIVSAFYNIENEMLKYLGVNCKIYNEKEKVDLIEMIYRFKNLYYSKYEIMEYINKLVDNKEQQYNFIDEFFKKSNYMRGIKIFNALKIGERLSLSGKSLIEIEKMLPHEERSIIKNISEYKVSNDLEEDLKRYYFLNKFKSKYDLFTATINDINIQISIMYVDLLEKLRNIFNDKSIKEEEKIIVYNNVINHLKDRDVEIDREIEKSKNIKRDLLSILYIRINAIEICRTLQYEEKLLQVLIEQQKLLVFNEEEKKEEDSKYKITDLTKEIIKIDNITKSEIRTFQNINKNIVPIIKDKYNKKFKLLNVSNKKVTRLILREVYIENKSKGNKNKKLTKIKKDYGVENIKLSNIIEKLKKNIELTVIEKIFIDTLINRGVALEKGILSNINLVDSIDIATSKIVRKIYLLNDLNTIEEFIYRLFNI